MERNLSNSEGEGRPQDQAPGARRPAPAHFLSLTEAELAPWRDNPVSRLLEEHLRRELETTQRVIVGLISGNDIPAARIATGGLLVVQSLLLAMHPPELPLPEPEEPFVDPADIVQPGVR